MPRKNHIYLLYTYVPILSVLLLVYFLCSRIHPRRPPMAPPGCYTAEQILRRTEPVRQLLAPRYGKLLSTPSLLVGHNRAGTQKRRKWLVEISDTRGNYKATLFCDADTGLVEQVSLSQDGPAASSSSRRLTPTEAIKSSLDWMVRLNMVRDKLWKLAATPKYVLGQWQCRFVSPHARAFVAVGAEDGQLIVAHTALASATSP